MFDVCGMLNERQGDLKSGQIGRVSPPILSKIKESRYAYSVLLAVAFLTATLCLWLFGL